jgi:hypothetical protein
VVEELEITSFVSLRDLFFEELSVAAGVAFCGGTPSCPTAGQFGLVDVQGEGALGHIELDEVPVLHEGERPSHRGLGRNMEDASAIGSPRHAGVGNAEEIADALCKEVIGKGKHAGLRDARGTDWSGILHHKHMVLGDAERGVMDPLLQVGVVLEDHRRPLV